MSVTRREFLAMPAFLAAAPATDARIEEIRIGFEDYLYRAPYKFGGKEVDRVTMLNVHCRLRTKAGKTAEGFAAMSMGNVWSFPAPDIPYDTTLAAMKTLAGKIARITQRLHRVRASARRESHARTGVSEGGGRDRE